MLLKLELWLASALVLSASLLWYPVEFLGDLKVHHVLLAFLAFASAFSGSLAAFILSEIRVRPFLYVSLILWYVVVFCLTSLFQTTWTPSKVSAFFLQIVMGKFAIRTIARARGLPQIARLLNWSLLVFLISFFFFSGYDLSETFQMFFSLLSTGNGRVLLNFFAGAPLFLSFSEDGLDGLRHTVSMYLCLVALINLFFNDERRGVICILASLFLIAIFQSRSAWLALFIPLTFFGLSNFPEKRAPVVWFMIIVVGLMVFMGGIRFLTPILYARVVETESYSERVDRFSSSIEYLSQFPLSPVSVDREFGSSHMFPFDSLYNGGIISFFFAALLVLIILFHSLRWKGFRLSRHGAACSLSWLLFVRLLTAGSGLPGLGATLGLAISLSVSQGLGKGAQDA